MITKTCVICGKTFEARQSNYLTCSKECSKQYREVNAFKMTKQCTICGKMFDAKQSNYLTCSKECSKQYQKQQNKQYREVNAFKMKRQCTICGKIFDAKQSNVYCCSKECSAENNKQQTKRYYQANAEKKKQYYQANAEKKKQYNKQYQQANPERIRQQTKQYYQANAAKIKQRMKQYIQTPNGRELHRLRWQRRNAMNNNIEHCFTKEQWIEKKQKTEGICPGCGKFVGIDKLTLDHIFPVVRANEEFKLMGVKRKYFIDDIQPLCKSCNSSKNASLVFEVAAEAFRTIMEIAQ